MALGIFLDQSLFSLRGVAARTGDRIAGVQEIQGSKQEFMEVTGTDLFLYEWDLRYELFRCLNKKKCLTVF